MVQAWAAVQQNNGRLLPHAGTIGHETGALDIKEESHAIYAYPHCGDLMSLSLPNDEFSSGAGCKGSVPRMVALPAPSAATACSACPWLLDHRRTTSPLHRQLRVEQPCRG